MAINKEQIWLVADEMLEAGESPTLAAVRKRVGGGSYTTISEALKEWRQREQQKARSDEVVVPEEVRALVAGAGKSIWQAALDLARSEIEGVKSALEAREKEIARERAEALALADQVSADLEQAQLEIERTSEQLSLAQADSREARAVSAEREQRILSLERELKEIRESTEKTSARAERLEADLTRARSDLESQAKMLETERAARTQAEKQIERLTSDLEGRQSDIDRMKEEYQKQFEKFQAQADEVREKMRECNEGRAALLVENARLQERADGLTRQAEFLQNRLVEFTTRKDGSPND